MDETGQPDNEHVGVGDETSATPAGGWQPTSNGAPRDVDGSRPDGVRRAPGLRTAETPWSSAGAALEPTMEPASTGWRRSLTSGLRGRAEVRSRYADLLAPVSPALPPTPARPGEVPASAPPHPYEGDLDTERPPSRSWIPPSPERPLPAAPPERPTSGERAAPPPEPPPYPQFRPSAALTDNTFDDLPALAQAAAASQAAQTAAQAGSAVQAARAAEAAAEARAVVEDHAAVEAAYRAAQGGTDTAEPATDRRPAPEPPAPVTYRATAARPDPRVPGTRPAEFRAPNHPPGEPRPPLAMPGGPRPPAQVPPPGEHGTRPPGPVRPPGPMTSPSGPMTRPPDLSRPGNDSPESLHPPTGGPAEPLRLVEPLRPVGPLPPAESLRSTEPLRPAALRSLGEPLAGASSPLPQRIPAPPDVPEVPDEEPDDQYVEQGERIRSGLAPPELARIATHLRYDEDLEEQATDRPDGFDVDTVLSAVRLVPGVRDAQLRPNPGGVHTLRLDLADGADPGQVSRLVARLLKQKMGLAAEPRRQGPNRPAGPPALPRDPGLPRDAVIPGVPPAPVSRPADQHSGLVPATAAHVDERSRHRVTPIRTREGHAEGEGRRAARPGTVPRIVIDQVQVSTLGLDATVEVRLTSNGAPAYGVASGPAVDGYVLRLAAVAATNAIDQLLSTAEGGERQGRSFVEHATVVPFGSCEVAVVVLLLVYGGTIEQLTGSALVSGDPRQAVVRATMAAVNRRLDSLLS